MGSKITVTSKVDDGVIINDENHKLYLSGTDHSQLKDIFTQDNSLLLYANLTKKVSKAPN